MEDLNKYMEKSSNSLSAVRSMVQEITDKKEKYFTYKDKSNKEI